MQIPEELSNAVRGVARSMAAQSGTVSVSEISGALLPALASIVGSVLSADPEFEKAGAHSLWGQMYSLSETPENAPTDPA